MSVRRSAAAAAVLLLAATGSLAAEPVVVELPEQAAVRTALVTVGDVARVTGGDPAARDRIARLDLAELKAREQGLTVTRRFVEYRLRLAGIDPAAVQFTGAERTALAVIRRAVTADEVVAAAKAELLRRLGQPPESVVVELAVPVALKLPEVPAAEPAAITAQPHGGRVQIGRVQMDVVVAAGGEKLLAFAVHLDVKPAGSAPSPVVPAGARLPAIPPLPAAGAAPAAAGELLVRPRQRVTMTVRSGVLSVSAVGEAQQGGRLGDTVPVQNVDSKKVITARVSGPGAVEVELGGAP